MQAAILFLRILLSNLPRSELRNAAYAGVVVPADIGGTSGIKGYKFQRSDRRIWLVWSLDGTPHTIYLPGTPLAAWDIMGVPVTPASSMEITVQPLFLEFNP